MLEDVEFKQEQEGVCISWRWSGEMEGMEIWFKRSGSPHGDGALFSENLIFRRPGDRTGHAWRQMKGEWGLYDFRFVVSLRDGSQNDMGLHQGILIGEKCIVRWTIEKKWGGTRLLLFPEKGFHNIPAGVICMAYNRQGRKYRYVLNREVDDRTRLEFAHTDMLNDFEVFAKEPYDRAYSFQRI